MVTTYRERRSMKLSRTDDGNYLPVLRLVTGYKSVTPGCGEPGERENLDREN